MSRGPDPKALARRRHDARVLMKEPEFRRLAEWLCRPADKLTFGGENTHGAAFNEGQRFAAKELRDLLREVDFDNFQRMEREARSARNSDTVHREPDSSTS